MKDPVPVSLKSMATFQSSWWGAFGAALQNFLEEAGRTVSLLSWSRDKNISSCPKADTAYSTGAGGNSPAFFPNFFQQDSCLVL